MSTSRTHAPLVSVAGWAGQSQLLTTVDVEPGAVLVAEYPIAFAQTHAGEDEVGAWLLLETILSSEEVHERVSAVDLKMTKWPLGAEDEGTLAHLAQKYRRNLKKLTLLYHRVAANNIRYAQAGVTGYGIWPTLSRSNHSCDPNAELRATPQSPLAELLVATRPIPKGSPVCWNYMADPSFLALGCAERSARLQRDFQFLCRCPRCLAERSPPASGQPGTGAYSSASSV